MKSIPLFTPNPTSVPLPVWAAALPPLSYYAALFLLPPLPKTIPKPLRRLASAARLVLAAVSTYSFFVLPLKYYYPGSGVLTYQLGLVGWYGGGRVLDVFFLSYPRVPRRITILPGSVSKPYTDGPNHTWKTEPHPRGLFSFERAWWALDLMISMRGIGWDFASPDVRHDTHPWQPPSSAQLRRAFLKLAPVLLACLFTMHHLHPDDLNPSITHMGHLQKPLFVAATGIALYALFDFGYTLTSALALPIMHDASQAVATRRSRPSSRVEKLRRSLKAPNETETDTETEDESPEMLKLRRQKAEQLSLRNVDFFPLLNPAGFTAATTVRRFWSYAWHRLFGRFFGIYGILPFTYLAYLIQDIWEGKLNAPERKLARRQVWPSYHADPMRALERGRADWAKVLGAFTASGIIHAVSERAALGGRVAVPVTNIWLPKDHAKGMGHELRAGAHVGMNMSSVLSPMRIVPPISGAGEFCFFFLNGVAVVIEGALARHIVKRRKAANHGHMYSMWYDLPIQITWTLAVLLTTGQMFVDGWIRSGISREISLIFE